MTKLVTKGKTNWSNYLFQKNTKSLNLRIEPPETDTQASGAVKSFLCIHCTKTTRQHQWIQTSCNSQIQSQHTSHICYKITPRGHELSEKERGNIGSEQVTYAELCSTPQTVLPLRLSSYYLKLNGIKAEKKIVLYVPDRMGSKAVWEKQTA